MEGCGCAAVPAAAASNVISAVRSIASDGATAPNVKSLGVTVDVGVGADAAEKTKASVVAGRSDAADPSAIASKANGTMLTGIVDSCATCFAASTFATTSRRHACLWDSQIYLWKSLWQYTAERQGHTSNSSSAGAAPPQCEQHRSFSICGSALCAFSWSCLEASRSQ